MRTIRGLEWARLSDDPPAHLKARPRLRGCRAKGKAFERRFGRYLARLLTTRPGRLYNAQWIAYFDAEGLHWMQPDFFIDLPDRIVLLECKLSQTNEAIEQTRNYYRLVLEVIFEKPVLCCQVCSNIRWDVGDLEIGSLDELLQKPFGPVYLWHFLGG